MTFLPEAYYAGLGTAQRAACDRQFAEWSTLRDAVAPFIGEHAATLFGHAISVENGAPATTGYLRAVLVDSGENPDQPTVTEAEQLLIDWGRQIARVPAGVSAGLRTNIEATFSEQLRVLLAAFAAQTIAANLFEQMLGIPIEA